MDKPNLAHEVESADIFNRSSHVQSDQRLAKAYQLFSLKQRMRYHQKNGNLCYYTQSVLSRQFSDDCWCHL